jgi:hypothetical protein
MIVDGSEEGARFPRALPTVRRDGQVVMGPPPPEDPLFGPLRPDDFRTVGAGEAFIPGAPATFASFVPGEPGEYTTSSSSPPTGSRSAGSGASTRTPTAAPCWR